MVTQLLALSIEKEAVAAVGQALHIGTGRSVIPALNLQLILLCEGEAVGGRGIKEFGRRRGDTLVEECDASYTCTC